MEAPEVGAAPVDEKVDEGVGEELLHVLPGHRHRRAVDHPPLGEAVHGGHHLVEDPLAPPGVRRLPEAFQGDGRREIGQLGQAVGRPIVDEGPVGVGHEDQVGVPVHQLQEALVGEGFAPREDDPADAQLLRLGEEPVQTLEGQGVGLVGARPAPPAPQVAPFGGIHQEEVGHVDSQLLGTAVPDAPAPEQVAYHPVDCHLLNHPGIPGQPFRLPPKGRVPLPAAPEGGQGRPVGGVGGEVLHQPEGPGHVLDDPLRQQADQPLQGAVDRALPAVGSCHSLRPPRPELAHPPSAFPLEDRYPKDPSTFIVALSPGPCNRAQRDKFDPGG